MEDSSRGGGAGSSFRGQANALLRKNLTIQKHSIKTNLRIVSIPILLCVLLVVIQMVVDNELDKPKNKCGCKCTGDGNGSCTKVCGIEYSTIDQVDTCPISSPPEWPPLMQVPRPKNRAVQNDLVFTADLPNESCRRTNSCPATVLFTGQNQGFARSVAQNFFSKSPIVNTSVLSSGNNEEILNALSNFTLGTDSVTASTYFIEPAFLSKTPIYSIQSQCNSSSTFSIGIPVLERSEIKNDAQCVQSLNVWRANSSSVNDVLYKGYWRANDDRSINEILTAYDFLDSDEKQFNVSIWYNSTLKNDSVFLGPPPALLRVGRSVNVVSNAFLQSLNRSLLKMPFEFIKEMPKPATKLELDFSSLLGPLFFKWVIELIFPVLLTYLVYEKQHKLRIMMKMHGLGDGAYWIISYGYFLLISTVYVLLFVIFGSVIGLKYFSTNDYSIQFVFYFSFINLQIVLAFLMAIVFSNVKAAQAIAYIYIFASGLLAANLLQSFIEDQSFPRSWVIVMELIPAFSLYRGLYELGQYSFTARYMGTSGMRWKDLNDSDNGMREVLIIIIVEWFVLLLVSYHLDQLGSLGSRTRKNPLPFLQYFQRKVLPSSKSKSFQKQGSKVFVEVEKADVIQERQIVEQLLIEPSTSYAIVSDNLKKVYPGRDGNPDKLAVQGLSLAIQRGECFGVLGPNGAGKTTFIHMMIGLLSPTSGNAYAQGHSILNDMNKIYTSMGVCPQHDMLWEMLTGREHLLFYGRLKNLKGSELLQAVEESLRSVNLFHGGVGDKQAGKYSGGMKRRLSVAISLIGDPKVVYMDEPSTGLDPASRSNLWNVVKNAKQNRAIILTTHSMEEAEVLCDRLGIFVGGGMQCIGNAKQLKARYGGSYVFTMTTSQNEERAVEDLVRHLSPNAIRTYHISGTQKFEIPKQDVKIADVFEAVEKAKRRFPIQAWGLSDATLEDVFIKVAKSEDSLDT